MAEKLIVIMQLEKNKIISLSIILALTAFGWSRFIMDLNYIYPGDWSVFLGQNEAIRRTILEFRQFPFWHPWHTGGTPLFARIDIGVFSLDTICVLIFGSVAGLKISIFIHLIIGALGMYALLKNYTKSELAKTWGALLFSLQGAIAVHIAAGHLNMISIIWMPWILVLVKKINSSFAASLMLGFILSVIANEGIHYIAIILFLFTAVTVIVQFFKHYKNRMFYFHLILLSLLFCSLSIYRLTTALNLALQFPREITQSVTIPLWRYGYALFYPGQYIASFTPMLNVGGTDIPWFWHEFGCYIGIIAAALFILSIFKGTRWWHIGFIITALLALDSSSRLLPGYWLRTLPVFKTMWVITRWRFFAIFFLIIGSCVGLDIFSDFFSKKTGKMKLLSYLLVIISVTGLIYNQFYNWVNLEKYNIHKDRLLASVPNKSDTIITSNYKYSFKNRLDYPCAAKGIGLIHSYENILGYSTNYKSARIPIEDKKNYKGEIFPIDKNILKILWTPNKIFINSKNKGRIWINQNPGSYWFLNGKQLYPGLKAFVMDQPFIINLPKGGDNILEARPPYNMLLLVINILFFILFGLALLLYRKFTKKNYFF